LEGWHPNIFYIILNVNIFLFLGFNLSLISILGFIWFNSEIEKVV